MKRMRFLNVTALCAVVMLASCAGGEKKGTVSDGDETPMVKIAKVNTQPVPQVAVYTATVEPFKRNQIISSMPNRIKKLYVEVGDHVKEGQKLVELDAANLTQQKVQLDNIKLEYDRVVELQKVGGASQQQVDQLGTQYEATKTAYENLLENTVLISPIPGVVTARNFDEGDMASGAAVYTVMQINPVKVLVNVSESDFRKVHVGMNVDITLDVYGDEVFKGKVSLIHPTIDAATRTFTVEINIPNAKERIRPGMFARVNMDFGSENRVVVPDRAVIKRAGSGDRFVYVYNDGKVSYNKVELGRHIGTTYELISGVENNSFVVIAGQAKLGDGMDVTVVE